MKFKSFTLIACIGVLASICSYSTRAEALLASIKSTGMAGTAIAYPQDSMAAAYNPAGAAWVGNRLDVSAAWLRDRGSARVTGNGLPAALGVNGHYNGMRTANFYDIEFGATNTYCFDCFEFAMGLVIYNRNFQKTTYKTNLPLFGISHAGLEYLHETVAPVFAFRFFDSHSIGITIDWQIQRLKVNGLQNFDNAMFSSNPGHVTNRGYAYSHGVTATIGYRWQITDCLAVGATYQPRTRMGRFHHYSGFIAKRGRLDIPEKIGAGISMNFCCDWTVCFDWEHVRWSKVKALHNSLLPNLNTSLLGFDQGAGFGFRNQNFYRLGLEYRINEMFTVRAGYRYANTPVRKSQAGVNLLTLDLVENVITVGGTWKINEANELSTFYAHGFEHKVDGKGAIPTSRGLGGGNVALKESKNVLGVAWGLCF